MSLIKNNSNDNDTNNILDDFSHIKIDLFKKNQKENMNDTKNVLGQSKKSVSGNNGTDAATCDTGIDDIDTLFAIQK